MTEECFYPVRHPPPADRQAQSDTAGRDESKQTQMNKDVKRLLAIYEDERLWGEFSKHLELADIFDAAYKGKSVSNEILFAMDDVRESINDNPNAFSGSEDAIKEVFGIDINHLIDELE